MDGQIECHFKDKYTFKASVSMVKMLLGFSVPEVRKKRYYPLPMLQLAFKNIRNVRNLKIYQL